MMQYITQQILQMEKCIYIVKSKRRKIGYNGSQWCMGTMFLNIGYIGSWWYRVTMFFKDRVYWVMAVCGDNVARV